MRKQFDFISIFLMLIITRVLNNFLDFWILRKIFNNDTIFLTEKRLF